MCPPDGNWQFGWLRDVHLTKTQTATIIFFLNYNYNQSLIHGLLININTVHHFGLTTAA